MLDLRSLIVFSCILCLLAPPVRAQDAAPAKQNDQPSQDRTLGSQIGQPAGPFARITRPYSVPQVPPINLANSNRIDQLMRAGRLYLSLQDAIALALENNLDVELS